MKQHLDNVEVIDYTDEFGKPTKPKKTQDSRVKNIKRPDDRDDYNQLNDFAASKSGKNTNFVGKTYTTNERALRAEEVEPLEELSKATLGRYVKKASHDVATKSAGVGRYSERSHKNLETYKSDKGDVEDRNTAYRSASKENALADRLFTKSWKRRTGIAKATDKLVSKGDE